MSECHCHTPNRPSEARSGEPLIDTNWQGRLENSSELEKILRLHFTLAEWCSIGLMLPGTVSMISMFHNWGVWGGWEVLIHKFEHTERQISEPASIYIHLC